MWCPRLLHRYHSRFEFQSPLHERGPFLPEHVIAGQVSLTLKGRKFVLYKGEYSLGWVRVPWKAATLDCIGKQGEETAPVAIAMYSQTRNATPILNVAHLL
jgi:hypothetical protein